MFVLEGRTTKVNDSLTKAEFAKVKKLIIDFVEGKENASQSSLFRVGVVINGK